MKIENELWDFAQDFYAQPNVSGALLALQDKYGCRINQLLFALWLASIKCHIKSIEVAGDNWGVAVINPLRAIRREVKALMQKSEQLESQLGACYKKLLSAEIATEQVELAYLHQAYLANSEPATKNISYTQLIIANLAFCKINSEGDECWEELEKLAVQYLALKVRVSDS